MSTPAPRRSIWFHVCDILLNIVIIVTIVAIIRTFIVSPFKIDGNSMSETLEHEEYIVINKFRYLFGSPRRGDIVVFHPETDKSKYYVKRIIGLPGETIIIRDGNVYLRDGARGDIELDEPYLTAINAGRTYRYPVNSGNMTEEVYSVLDGQYFVLGDNRQGSLDSRTFAHLGGNYTSFIPESDIKGSVWFVALPISKIHAFEPPKYAL